MRIWIADGDKKRMKQLYKRTLENGYEKKELKKFSSTDKIIGCLKKNKCDVLFIGVDDPGFNWVSVITNIKNACPRCNLIFVCDSGDIDSRCVYYRISGYLQRPFTKETVRTELDNLRFAVEN